MSFAAIVTLLTIAVRVQSGLLVTSLCDIELDYVLYQRIDASGYGLDPTGTLLELTTGRLNYSASTIYQSFGGHRALTILPTLSAADALMVDFYDSLAHDPNVIYQLVYQRDGDTNSTNGMYFSRHNVQTAQVEDGTSVGSQPDSCTGGDYENCFTNRFWDVFEPRKSWSWKGAGSHWAPDTANITVTLCGSL